MPFDRLQNQIKQLKNPIAVRLCGLAPCADATALLEALRGVSPAVILSPAGYLRRGVEGVRALGELLAQARALGFYTIADLRVSARGEEAAAYADAFLTPGAPFEVDALTAAPYLGSEGILPLVTAARAQDKGIFIVARTYAELPGELQDMVAGDRLVYTVAAALADRLGQTGGEVRGHRMPGVVVDAACPAELRELRRRFEAPFFFVPGFDGSDKACGDLSRAFDRYGRGALLDDGGALETAWLASPGDITAHCALRDAIKAFITIL